MFIEQAVIPLFIIHLMAVMSPGPDFALILKHSLGHRLNIGVMTAFGIALGCTTHLIYTITGIALFIQKHPQIQRSITSLGALYIGYIGVMSLKAAWLWHKQKNEEVKVSDMTHLTAFKRGLITNILNPKATLYFLSVFSGFLKPSMPLWQKCFLGVEVVLITFLWFSILSFILSRPSTKSLYLGWSRGIEFVMGGIFVGFSFKLLFLS